MGRSRWLRSILAILAFLLTTVATLLFFAQDRFLDSDDFGATAAASLSDPAINEYLALEISDALIDQAPNLATGGSLVQSLTSGVLESSAAQGVVQASVTEAHRTVFEEDADTFVVAVSDVVLMVDQTMQALVPDMAELMPPEAENVVVSISSGDLFTTIIDGARTLRQLTIIVAVLAVVALFALILTDTTPWAGITTTGVTLGVVGLFILVLQVVGGVIVGSFAAAGAERAAVTALWQLVFGELQTWGWLLVAAGAFLAGLSWAVSHVGQTRSLITEQLQRLTAEPRTPLGRAMRLAVIGLVAVWGILDPLSLAAVAIRIVGFAAAVAVVAEVVEVTGLDHRIAAITPADTEVRSWRSILGQATVPAFVIGGLAVAAVAVLAADPPSQAGAGNDACNGHVELCERRFDEVAIVASHNSMSSTDTDFYLPNQTSTIIEQLDQGVRGLLIDTWYGRSDRDGTIITDTDFVNMDNLDAQTQAAVQAARTRSNLGPQSIYLCHSVCEIGALDGLEVLTEVREWMERNPREILTIVVQDATSPEDTAQLFEQAGLDALAHVQEFGQPFPTLEEMIAGGKRLFVLVEEDGGDIDWLHPAFEFVQETPFSFSAVEDFSCDMNRGRDDSPLFMVNHFITPALNGNRTINEADVVGPRLAECERERGMTPTVIAADFVAHGDLMAAVDELNGVGSDN